MVSPDRSDYRRLQAETPLIVLFKFAEPALNVCFEAQTGSTDIQLVGLAVSSQILSQALIERMPHFALGGLRSVLDFRQQ
jgi:hypothetical protein